MNQDEAAEHLRRIARGALTRMMNGQYVELLEQQLELPGCEDDRGPAAAERGCVAYAPGTMLISARGRTPSEALLWLLAQAVHRMERFGPTGDPMPGWIREEVARLDLQLPRIDAILQQPQSRLFEGGAVRGERRAPATCGEVAELADAVERLALLLSDPQPPGTHARLAGGLAGHARALARQLRTRL
jgi:hypothetical protein